MGGRNALAGFADRPTEAGPPLSVLSRSVGTGERWPGWGEQRIGVKHRFQQSGVKEVAPYGIRFAGDFIEPSFGFGEVVEHLLLVPVVRQKDHGVGHGIFGQEFIQGSSACANEASALA